MDKSVLLSIIVALISVLGAVVVATITYFFTKRREREAEWRKLKLEHYREYVRALSGIVERRSTTEAQARYSDAANSLMLVAPANVLAALTAYSRWTSESNWDKSDLLQHDLLLSALLREMRQDAQPSAPNDDEDFVFRLMDIPKA